MCGNIYVSHDTHWSIDLVIWSLMMWCHSAYLWYLRYYRCDATSLVHKISYDDIFYSSSIIVWLILHSCSIWRFHISINCGESVATVTPWKIFSLLWLWYRVTADMTLWLYGTHYWVKSALGYQYALPQIRYTVCDDYWHHTVLFRLTYIHHCRLTE